MQRNDFVSNSSSCSFIVLNPQNWYDGYQKQHAPKTPLQELKKYYGQFNCFCFDKTRANTDMKQMLLHNLVASTHGNELTTTLWDQNIPLEFISYLEKTNKEEYEELRKDEKKYFETKFKERYVLIYTKEHPELMNSFDVLIPSGMDEMMLRDFLDIMVYCGKTLGEWEDIPPELYCWLKYNNISYQILTYQQ